MKTNIKLRVTPEQSVAVQKICFAKGLGWGENLQISYIDAPFLFIKDPTDKDLIYSFNEECFNKEEGEEVDADLFIRTNGTCEESIDIVDNLSNNKSREAMFKQYGFEVPDFDCELLGIVSGPYKKDEFVVGTIKKGIFNNCPHMWSIKYGTCYTSSIASNMYDYNLTPIKQPWYETCKFPVLVMDNVGNTFVIHTRKECNDEYLSICRPLSNDEIDQLKQDF